MVMGYVCLSVDSLGNHGQKHEGVVMDTYCINGLCIHVYTVM